MAPATVDVACERLLASMAIHVGLERTWAGESLVADLAFVLLLRVGREFG